MIKLKLLEFILNNEDWETILQEKPYGLKIVRDGEFILFKYGITDSNFNLQLVREARGIIFHEPTWTPVCVPFFKFGNYGESYVPEIDWETAEVYEKIDGSLIKVWFYDGEIHISTNGTIDAFNAPLDGLSPYASFGDLFMAGIEKRGLTLNDFFDFEPLTYCYMFELCSPYNKVVVPHTEIELYFLGIRNMETLEEIRSMMVDIPSPQRFPLHSLDDCLKACETMPFSEEGYVVVDGNWNRIKIKSPAYVVAHHLRGEGVVTWKRIVEMALLTNESSEFLNYYPEYAKHFEKVVNRIGVYSDAMQDAINHIEYNRDLFVGSRKQLAMYAKTTFHPSFIFSWWDGKVNTFEEWLSKMQPDKIVKILGLDKVNPLTDFE